MMEQGVKGVQVCRAVGHVHAHSPACICKSSMNQSIIAYHLCVVERAAIESQLMAGNQIVFAVCDCSFIGAPSYPPPKGSLFRSIVQTTFRDLPPPPLQSFAKYLRSKAVHSFTHQGFFAHCSQGSFLPQECVSGHATGPNSKLFPSKTLHPRCRLWTASSQQLACPEI